MRGSDVSAFLRVVLRAGGSKGNEQLTAVVAGLLVVLLAAEGATLLNLRSLLGVHAFIGMLLIPVVALKVASVGWRMLRYYGGRDEYVAYGPPQILLRTIVAPVILVSTFVLFGTGVVLLARGEAQGTLVGLHKASFVVWFGATGVHVLVHVFKLRRALARPLPGLALRLAAVGAAVLAGTVVAVGTLPSADHLQDQVTQHVGFDRH
jgi:hypothetical protein